MMMTSRRPTRTGTMAGPCVYVLYFVQAYCCAALPLPVHLQKAYVGRSLADPGFMAKTERAAREVLGLSMHAFLSDEDVAYVIEGVKAASR